MRVTATVRRIPRRSPFAFFSDTGGKAGSCQGNGNMEYRENQLHQAHALRADQTAENDPVDKAQQPDNKIGDGQHQGSVQQ